MDSTRMHAFRGRWGTLFVILCLCELRSAIGQARYSVPEEQAEGSFVGNIAKDLGLDVARLVAGKARIIAKGGRQYVDLKRDKGTLVIKERIDREELCGKTTPCSFSFDIILENPIQIYHVTVEVVDINDNSPSFPQPEIHLKIAESVASGARFSLENADDSDVGINYIQKLTLNPSDHFKLEIQNQPDGAKFTEMVLKEPLDREKEETHTLILIASDGGEPRRSGTVRIQITVLDANDNAPVCSQSVYKVDVMENSPRGTLITTVRATDADAGLNGDVTYSTRSSKDSEQLFDVNDKTGEIKVIGKFDFEKARSHQLNVQARDHGGYTDTCKVFINIIDENDNIPLIEMMSFSQSIPEDSPPGTTVAVFNVNDEDSEGNGVVKCSISPDDVPFKIESSISSYYSIVTENFLDRESVPDYNVTITAQDQGSPPLSSKKMINVKIADVNDNHPKFQASEYSKTVPENNSPGFSIFMVSARDADSGQNARVAYFLEEKEINGVPVSSFVSVNSESGVIHAIKSFDFEQIKSFDFNVTARDSGSPPLTSVATVTVHIQDTNDNGPQVLYPVQTGGSVLAEMVPRSADAGYLVTKVVAVDVDSGQNAWLSYKVHRASDRALFEVGLHNGEIRTIRQVTDKDAVKQRLTVVVEDNGQPSRSATVVVNVAVADSFPEVLSEFTDFNTYDKEYNDKLTFYLVLALAVVSFLFIVCLILIISVKVYRWRQSRILYHSNLPVIPYYPPRYSDTLGTGTLPHVYNYEVCRTMDSRKSDMKNISPSLVNVDEPEADALYENKQMSGNRSHMSTLPSALFFLVAMDKPGPFPLSYVSSRSLFNGWRRQIGTLLFLLALVTTVSAQIRYSIPEEMKRGSLIGNVAQDLGLDVKRLISGRARILTEDNTQYTELRADKGLLLVHDRIDREQLCGDVTPCSFSFEIILENPLELHRIIVEVLDVNDHPPLFPNKERALIFDISESALVGGRFPLESAEDQDVGQNSLQNYIISANDNFILNQHANPDGSKYVEMVLQKPLDRETRPHLSLKLIAVDGGTPQRSGTVNININVLDANDNEPVFNQSVYKANIMENTVKGTSVITVNATDADSGSNGLITYTLSKMKGSAADIFNIDPTMGTIYVSGQLDYEKNKKYEVRVEAKDQGGLTGTSKVIFEVIDVNDNAPVINIKSFSSPLSEDSPPGTTIAILNIKDADSEGNGQIKCSIDGKIPFKVEPSLTNYYNLISDRNLDRESISEYNITITATDLGTPPLSSSTQLHLRISDVNDNAPSFDKNMYTAYVAENNSPGVSIFAVTARDVDSNQNARISYLLEDTQISGSPVSTFVSLNSETGVLSAIRSFDYEQMKQLDLVVRAQDGGSPPLSSNVSVTVLVRDANDNGPQVLYPVQTGGSVLAEMVPRSADAGYLVTKVVAVDVDSGQNAWLSYKVHRASDRALFEVGLHNGEIRTIRQVTDKDAVKQRLTVVVEDNGQPSRSATVVVNVAVADSFPEVLSEFTDFNTYDKDYNDKLTFYLVLALAVVSFLFITCLILIISVKVYRWRQSRIQYHSNLPVIPYYPPRYSDTLGTGTLPHVYNYEVCRTMDSRKSDMKSMAMSPSLVSVDGPDGDMPTGNKHLSGLCSQMSTLMEFVSWMATANRHARLSACFGHQGKRSNSLFYPRGNEKRLADWKCGSRSRLGREKTHCRAGPHFDRG
ncbi:uncharacterized protein LOC144082601 [Stigmatopora argus]